jgi:DNA polymerase III epsilon subunit-like protein
MSVHLNGNVLAVIDTETTGPLAGYHDIIEICVIVLGPDLQPAKNFMPFNLEIQPRRIENIDLEALRIQGKDLDLVVKEKLCRDRKRVVKITTNGCDADLAADLFGIWWDKLKFAPFKRLMPIAHNWVFDRGFLIDWLGLPAFEYYFDPRYRDIMGMSLYDNDVSDWRSEQFEYPKNNLGYLCNILKVDRGNAHTALDDVLATAEIYRKLITRTEIRSLPKTFNILDEIKKLPKEEIIKILDNMEEN